MGETVGGRRSGGWLTKYVRGQGPVVHHHDDLSAELRDLVEVAAAAGIEDEQGLGRAAGLPRRDGPEIAEQLVISERTVETHLASVYAKLGVASKVELVRRADELGL